MKVGIYDPYLDTLSGGEKYMLSIASCLQENDDIFIFWDSAEDIKIKAENKLGIDLSKAKFTKNIFSSNVSFLDRFNQSRKFDAIIYLSDGSIPVVACNLYVHFQFPVEWVKSSLRNKLKLKKAKKIICNSFFTKSFIDRKFGVDSTVLYPPASSFNASEKENIILHVGRLSVDSEGVNYKKQDIMINAFKEMIDKGLKSWELVLIIGTKKDDENKLEFLKQMAKGYPIKIIDNPSQDTLASYYSKSKIYWHATGFGEDMQRNPEKAEHFGMTTVEAMSAGCVPVVINAGGQVEIVTKEDGFLWDSLEQLKEYTLKLINSEDLLLNMSKSCQARSKSFTGERFCAELKEIIK